MQEERKLYMRYQIVPLIVILFLFSACSGNGEAIKIEDKSFANTLFIQKVEDNSTAEELSKIVRDKEKIEQVLSLVEGLKVEEIKKENFFDELKSHNSYMFGFLKDKKIKTGKIPYSFYILDDGTFLFNYENDDSQRTLRVTIEKQKKLFEEIKQLLKIDF